MIQRRTSAELLVGASSNAVGGTASRPVSNARRKKHPKDLEERYITFIHARSRCIANIYATNRAPSIMNVQLRVKPLADKAVFMLDAGNHAPHHAPLVKLRAPGMFSDTKDISGAHT